ncbi:hypothetical protein ACH4U6_05275 [Streptomyces netropsis]|uniref:Uncharacterized protein n=1 Tax=Streptomyces netropsis TaxID=55404 RepID=A0A7W7LE26_STRNE|nr:hypothetical protein [Streptomyces netropsis]MBB4888490.1 hypothetical protein [Streptomyces netropsis]GGR28900.1 hypothetical protein GCM10010219_37040 [Streptomyces netropsis]
MNRAKRTAYTAVALAPLSRLAVGGTMALAALGVFGAAAQAQGDDPWVKIDAVAAQGDDPWVKADAAPTAGARTVAASGAVTMDDPWV